MCGQVRKLLLHLLFWKPLAVVVGTCGPPRGTGVLSSPLHVIHTGEAGEAEKVGERNRHKGHEAFYKLGLDVIRIWVSPFYSLIVTPLPTLCI